MKEIQKCGHCKEIKILSMFVKHRARVNGYSETCKECRSIMYKEKAKKIKNGTFIPYKLRKLHSGDYGTKEYYRSARLKQFYNITIQEYNNMFEKQEGCCGICGIHQSKLSSSLNVDHDHLNNKIRALLCTNCNTALGKFKDSIEILEKALKYLKYYII